jgi:hypothetical protein
MKAIDKAKIIIDARVYIPDVYGGCLAKLSN